MKIKSRIHPSTECPADMSVYNPTTPAASCRPTCLNPAGLDNYQCMQPTVEACECLPCRAYNPSTHQCVNASECGCPLNGVLKEVRILSYVIFAKYTPPDCTVDKIKATDPAFLIKRI